MNSSSNNTSNVTISREDLKSHTQYLLSTFSYILASLSQNNSPHIKLVKKIFTNNQYEFPILKFNLATPLNEAMAISIIEKNIFITTNLGSIKIAKITSEDFDINSLITILKRFDLVSSNIDGNIFLIAKNNYLTEVMESPSNPEDIITSADSTYYNKNLNKELQNIFTKALSILKTEYISDFQLPYSWNITIPENLKEEESNTSLLLIGGAVAVGAVAAAYIRTRAPEAQADSDDSDLSEDSDNGDDNDDQGGNNGGNNAVNGGGDNGGGNDGNGDGGNGGGNDGNGDGGNGGGNDSDNNGGSNNNGGNDGGNNSDGGSSSGDTHPSTHPRRSPRNAGKPSPNYRSKGIDEEYVYILKSHYSYVISKLNNGYEYISNTSISYEQVALDIVISLVGVAGITYYNYRKPAQQNAQTVAHANMNTQVINAVTQLVTHTVTQQVAPAEQAQVITRARSKAQAQPVNRRASTGGNYNSLTDAQELAILRMGIGAQAAKKNKAMSVVASSSSSSNIQPTSTNSQPTDHEEHTSIVVRKKSAATNKDKSHAVSSSSSSNNQLTLTDSELMDIDTHEEHTSISSLSYTQTDTTELNNIYEQQNSPMEVEETNQSSSRKRSAEESPIEETSEVNYDDYERTTSEDKPTPRVLFEQTAHKPARSVQFNKNSNKVSIKETNRIYFDANSANDLFSPVATPANYKLVSGHTPGKNTKIERTILQTLKDNNKLNNLLKNYKHKDTLYKLLNTVISTFEQRPSDQVITRRLGSYINRVNIINLEQFSSLMDKDDSYNNVKQISKDIIIDTNSNVNTKLIKLILEAGEGDKHEDCKNGNPNKSFKGLGTKYIKAIKIAEEHFKDTGVSKYLMFLLLTLTKSIAADASLIDQTHYTNDFDLNGNEDVIEDNNFIATYNNSSKNSSEAVVTLYSAEQDNSKSTSWFETAGEYLYSTKVASCSIASSFASSYSKGGAAKTFNANALNVLCNYAIDSIVKSNLPSKHDITNDAISIGKASGCYAAGSSLSEFIAPSDNKITNFIAHNTINTVCHFVADQAIEGFTGSDSSLTSSEE